MFKLLNQFNHKAEIRESQDEMLVGEIVRAMARQGHPAVAFRAHSDRQAMRFKTISDPVLHSVWITLDRKTGNPDPLRQGWWVPSGFAAHGAGNPDPLCDG